MQVSIHLGKRNTLTEISKAQIFVKQSILYNLQFSFIGRTKEILTESLLFKSFDNNVFDLHFVKSRND